MIKTLINNNDLKVLKDYLENLHSKDIADLLIDLSYEQRSIIVNLLTQDKLNEVISYLPPIDAAGWINELTLEKQVDIIEGLEPDDAREVVLSLPEETVSEILDNLDKDAKVFELLNYSDDEAGSFMTNLFIALPFDLDVKAATKQVIRMAGLLENIKNIYIIDHEGKYLGQTTLFNLVKAKPPMILKDLLETTDTFLDKGSIDELAELIKYYQEDEIAIVDSNDKLIGIVTADDILDLIKEDFEFDYESIAALPDSDENLPIFKAAFKRLPWLSILLLIAIPIAFLTAAFEEVIAGAVILALFQPLILDAGGDVATQTLAVSLITIDDKEKVFIKNGWKEIISGVITSFILGIFSFFIVYLFAVSTNATSPLLTSFAISISLVFTIIIGSALGFLVPYILSKTKFDPLVASGPLITTIIDIVSLLIYFGIASLTLGGLI